MVVFSGAFLRLTVQVKPINLLRTCAVSKCNTKTVFNKEKEHSHPLNRKSVGRAWPAPTKRGLRRRGGGGRCRVATKAALALPHLLPATTVQGIWTALIIAAAAGLWSERTRYSPTLSCREYCHQNAISILFSGLCRPCRIGKELSGPLVSTLIGLLFSNLGLVGGVHAGTVYDTVNKFILPLAIPLLLYSADLRYWSTHQPAISFSWQVKDMLCVALQCAGDDK